MELSQSNEVGGSPSSPAPDKSPLKIFINYRHDDTKGTAWALYFKLEERFGAENVFFDNGTLQPGMRWPTEIRSHLGAGGAFLALIGQDWLPILDARLQSGAEDYVAEEIDLALRGGPGMTVIPVLVDEAKLPDSGQLPSSLRTLLSCHQEHLRHTHFPHDTDNLIRRLGQIQEGLEVARVDTGDPPRRRRRRPRRERVAPPPDQEHYEMVAGHADNLVIFLGAGANADHDEPWSMGSGMLPDDRDLVKHLASHIGLKEAPRHLAEIAQYVGTVYGEMELFEWITQALRVESEPSPVHRYLARLPGRLGGRYQMIVTPKYDASLEKAFKEADEGFDLAVYMAPGTDQAGRFVHIPWGGRPQPIDKPNEYTGFPVLAADRRLQRTIIMRISGTVDDPSAGLPWEDNYVITEDHYIGYLNGRSAEEGVPGQLLSKLRKAHYLFLGYTIADWRLRVFLQRVWKGNRPGQNKHWAIEQEPDVLERDLWQQAGVSLYQCSLADYLIGLHDFLRDHPGEARP